MPTDAVKLRFREPYMSEGNNLKSSGIVPAGIYQGFTPNVGADPNVLILNTDGTRNDSVAVCETYLAPPDVANYNLTIRSTDQLQLDFTGHTVFPCWVVLRPAYSIVAHPFSGTTSAQFVTINTLTINDAVATARHHGDIKICKVTSIGPVVYDTTIPTNRDGTGGPLVTFSSLSSSLVTDLPFTKIASIFTSIPTIDAPSQTYPNTSVPFTTTVTQDILADLQISGSTAGNGGPALVLVRDYVSVGVPGTDSSTQFVFGSAMGPSSMAGCSKMLFPSVPAGSHAIRLKLLGDTGPTSLGSYLCVVYYK
jgi:hypothetical protein